MRRGWIIAVCLVACAEIHPDDPEDQAVDAGEDPSLPATDGGVSTIDQADAGGPPPDAAPGDVQERVFGADKIIDTYLRLNNPTFNYGVGPRMCADTTTDDRRILVRVDVSTLAAGVEVVGAELHIWTGTAANDLSTQIYSIYPVLEAWNEGQQDAAAGISSWNLRKAATPWTTAGAGTGSRGDDAVGSFVPAAIDTEYAVAIEPALVQAWIDDAGANHGVEIVSAGADGGCFASSEYATASKRPFLVVSYR